MISISSNTGAVNVSLAGMTPNAIVSLLVAMFIQAIPGGAGMGMVYMLVYVILTLFVVGLMVGKTPEFMSMKISPKDVKKGVFLFLLHPALILIPTAIAFSTGYAQAIVGDTISPLGYTQTLYEFTSAGTAAAKEAANMVDLDSDPSNILKVVRLGKQLLMTRGAITTFSIANDAAKYFALLPAMFMTQNPKMQLLNVMHLHSPETAILSTLIFNALIIPALIPLSLRGIKFKPEPPEKTFIKNMLIYGIGGAALPFVAIKIIDMILTLFIG
jgi:K+-transporting ATPase A subunit